MRELILFALVAAFVAITVAEMKIAAPLRALPKVGALFSCGWCLSFWLSLGLVLVFHPSAGLYPGAVGIGLDWALSAFIAGMVSLTAKALLRLSGA